MAFVWQEDDDDDDQDQGQQAPPPEPPPALRKHLRQLERKLKDLEKEKAEWSATVRTATVVDVVKAEGYDPKIADLIPSTVDGADAIRAWLGERSSVFAKVSTGNSEQDDSDEGGVDVDTVEAFNALQQVSAAAQPATKLRDLEALIKGAKTVEELNEVMRRAGAKI